MSATPMVATGAVLAGYRLGERLRPGRVGTVYEAVEESSGRRVALRVVEPPQASRPDLRDRLLAAAEAQGRVGSPHVVAIDRAGEEDGLLFVAMQLVDGDSLNRLLDADDAALDATALLRLLRQVAAGLDEAHASGLAHGDLSSRAVLVEAGGGALLTDFGAAGEGSAEEDRRAFAALVYESLCGRSPGASPTPPSEINPALPPAWDPILTAALADDPPPTATALLDGLE
ncbi:MAG TPA: protein kinase, partial [Solirubrobacteraceae bacterium]|nr:protein kinase [Solirubrobacteraceae bacterium]